MTKTAAFFSWVLFFPIFGIAQTCKEVDLRPKMGPIQNQNGMSWCFAYSASDIVSFHLGQRVSPVDIAVQYHRDWAKQQLKKRAVTPQRLREKRQAEALHEMAGPLDYAIEAAAPAGFCAAEKINLNDLAITGRAGVPFAFLDELNMNKFNYENAETTDCYKFQLIQKLTPWNSFEKIEKIAKENTLADVSGVMINQACGERIKPAKPMIVKKIENSYDPAKTSSLTQTQRDQVNRVISGGKPVAILTYLEKLKIFSTGDEKNLQHAMTIVGKQFNPATGKCEYIVRNSWGPECDSGWKPGVRCDNNSGYLFVDTDLLEQATFAAYYIE